jgi:hypothetical protein
MLEPRDVDNVHNVIVRYDVELDALLGQLGAENAHVGDISESCGTRIHCSSFVS